MENVTAPYFFALVDEIFAFLRSGGFSTMVAEENDLVWVGAFESERVQIALVYAPQNGELTLEIRPLTDPHPISFETILAYENVMPRVGQFGWDTFSATSGRTLRDGITNLANLVKRHGAKALSGDQQYFERLAVFMDKQSGELERQPVWESAIRVARVFADVGDFLEVIRCLSKYEGQLSDEGRDLLALARTRAAQ